MAASKVRVDVEPSVCQVGDDPQRRLVVAPLPDEPQVAPVNLPKAEGKANDQVKQGAAANPVLQQGALNFRPQDLVQLLQGNTDEDNAVLQRIAGRIVRQQRTIEPATRAMSVTLPEEGQVYRFERALQVAENAPLKLELEFGDRSRPDAWKVLLVLAMILGLAAMLGWQGRRMDAEPG